MNVDSLPPCIPKSQPPSAGEKDARKRTRIVSRPESPPVGVELVGKDQIVLVAFEPDALEGVLRRSDVDELRQAVDLGNLSRPVYATDVPSCEPT
jgi:hypothetical protein